jgi:hypothetical protein
MGIAGVIRRAKKSVRSGGLPEMVVGLGGSLRSKSIPPPLRHAASRIADLLRVPSHTERGVIPLVPDQASRAIDACTRGESGADPRASAHGGACPFTGHTADAGPINGTPIAVEEARTPSSEEPLAHGREVAEAPVASAARSVEVLSPPEEGASQPRGVATLDLGEEAAPEITPSVEAREPSVEAREQSPKAQARTSGASKSVRPPKASEAPAPVREQNKPKNEKAREALAAKPGTAKSAARSGKGPVAKQPAGKSKKKK